MSMILVPLNEATDRQLILEMLARQAALEAAVTDLTQAVADLQTAVAGVAARIDAEIGSLRQQITDAQALVEQLQAVDATDQATITDLQQQLAAALAGASTAADAVEAQAADLNGLAQPPTA